MLGAAERRAATPEDAASGLSASAWPAADDTSRVSTRTATGSSPGMGTGTSAGAGVVLGLGAGTGHDTRAGTGSAAGPASRTDWAASLRSRPRSARDAVLRTAPARGPVALVTVRDVNGHPVIDSVSARDRSRAAGVVDRALVDPTVLDVSVATQVQIAASADPYRGTQWSLDALGAEQAWSKQRADGVTVAVVDTGVQASHPDLAGVVLPGHDFVTAGGTGQTDEHGHGTHVAGLIAAVAGNGIGIAGLAQGAHILPVRALDKDGVGSDAAVASGIIWAADNGANIINLSLGSPDYSAAEAAAVSYALGRGVLVVAAAGNQRTQGNPTSYPGALPGVLAVAASTPAGQTASFSSTGSYVSVTAPGVSLVSTYPPATYMSMDGTSMAAPLAAAAAALVRAANPSLNPAQISQVLEETAKDLEAPGRDPASGYGLIQPVAAIDAARQLVGSGAGSGSGTGAGSSTGSGSGSGSGTPGSTPSPSGSTGAPGGATPGVPGTPGTQPPSTPPPVARPARASALTVDTAPRRIGFRTAATLTFRLRTVAGPLVDATLSICARPAASSSSAVDSCTPAITNADGLATARLTLAATSTVTARYAGASGVGASVSPAWTVAVLPSIRLTVSPGSVSVTVAPAKSGETVRLQRLTGSIWTTVASRVLGPGGRIIVTGLVPGTTYRVSVPATGATLAAVSSAVRAG